jgi:hypothetical protein
MAEMRNVCIILSDYVKGRDQSKGLEMDGRIILKGILGNRLRGNGLDSSGSG